MSTEVWFRNPYDYIRELVEVGEYKVAWDRGMLVKKNIDPKKHADLYFGKTFPYRLLLVGDQGTAEIRPDSTFARPSAVYPTWVYGEDAALLEEIIARPVGMDLSACSDFSVPPDERPVIGQEHRVVITEIPNAHTGPGRKFLRHLKELQEDYPDCIIHVHGLYGWRTAFGLGFGSADVEPRIAAQKGKVHLPSGKEEKYERVQAHPQWVTALGFKPVDLAVPRNRCMYNIKSAVWAGKYYTELYNFKTRDTGGTVDHESPNSEFAPAETKSHMSGKSKPEDGDRFVCNTCSLQRECKYFREGAVCTVPGAEPTELAKFFNSRDSNLIIDGLGTLVAANTRRLERGMQIEEIDGDIDPNVSRIMGQVFDQGVKLAKLINPALAGPKVQVNVGPGGQANLSAAANPKALAAAAIRALEEQGVPREQITGEMIQNLLAGMVDPMAARKQIESNANGAAIRGEYAVISEDD